VGRDFIRIFKESSQIFIHINMRQAIKDEIEFYISKNEVILSSGEMGVIRPEYFQKAICRETGENVLMKPVLHEIKIPVFDGAEFNIQAMQTVSVHIVGSVLVNLL